MYSECKGSQDKKIVMIGIRKGLQKRRCGMKGQDEEKSTAQEENCNKLVLLFVEGGDINLQLLPDTFCQVVLWFFPSTFSR